MSIEEKTIGESAESSWDFSDEAEFIVAYRSSLRVLAADGFQAFTLREGEGVFIPPRTISSVIASERSAIIHKISFPLSLFDMSKESRLAWFLKVYMLKPIYFYGMLNGLI